MDEQLFFNYLITIWFLLAVIVFIVLFFISAPYGRYIRKGWGLSLSSRLGWLLMESPAALVFAYLFLVGSYRDSIVSIIFFLVWESHYIYRAFIYPFSLSGSSRPMPLAVMMMAFIFNVGNGYINGRYIFYFSGGYQDSWLLTAPFISGMVLFIGGYIINRQADYILRQIRKNNSGGYQIPQGYLYSFISSPNYFGEIIQWIGWAIMTWSIAGLAFAVWTIANLIPRAYTNHIWYRRTFSDYPVQRKALIPGLW